MTNQESIKILSQVLDVLLKSNSWLESTHNPLKEAFGMAISALEQPQRTGKWIDSHGHTTIDGHDMSELFVRCSECGHDYPDLKDMRFCPNCGCRMTEDTP